MSVLEEFETTEAALVSKIEALHIEMARLGTETGRSYIDAVVAGMASGMPGILAQVLEVQRLRDQMNAAQAAAFTLPEPPATVTSTSETAPLMRMRYPPIGGLRILIYPPLIQAPLMRMRYPPLARTVLGLSTTHTCHHPRNYRLPIQDGFYTPTPDQNTGDDYLPWDQLTTDPKGGRPAFHDGLNASINAPKVDESLVYSRRRGCVE